VLDVEEVDGSEAHVEVELGVLLELDVGQLLYRQQLLRGESRLFAACWLVRVAPARPVSLTVSVIFAFQELLVCLLVNANFYSYLSLPKG
jgi:hypothetical protein